MTAPSAADLIAIDRSQFGVALGRQPMKFAHSVADHALLGLDAIAELADSWPERWVEHHLADLPLLLPLGDPPGRLDVDAGEIVRGLDHNMCWMVLWFVETVRAYEALLDECLDRVVDVVRERDGAMGAPRRQHLPGLRRGRGTGTLRPSPQPPPAD